MALPKGSTQVGELAPPPREDAASGGSTPNSSPIIKRGLPSILGHRRKASNEGLERNSTSRVSTSLMDSLNLDHPLLNTRTNSSTLPRLGGRASPSGLSQKQNNLVRSKKNKGGGGGFQKSVGLYYDDVIFGLDKRASIRSDPGDREQGKSRVHKSQMGGSSHTSPTSSITGIHTDATHPINIPHSKHSVEQEGSGNSTIKVGSDSFGKSPGNNLSRNASLQSKGSKGRGGINKGNISLPKGPLYKEVLHSPKRVKVVGEFLFEYSGGQGAAEGYYRETEANVSVLVRPCLLFEQFDVSSSDK